MKSLKIALAAVMLLAAAPALAHHNANAQYDTAREMQITGTLMELRDIAPHAVWQVRTVDPVTKAQTDWRFEAMGNAALRRIGVKLKTDFKVGGNYGYIYVPARDGTSTGLISAIIINGQTFRMVRF